MRAIRVSIVLAVALVIMGHSPGAWACSCAAPLNAGNSHFFKYADAVFVGTVTSRSGPTEITSGNQLVTWTFKVSSVQKGSVRSIQKVQSQFSGAACGDTFTVGRTYQIFAFHSGSSLQTGLCSGNHLITAGSPIDLAPTGGSLQLVLIGLLVVAAGLALKARRSPAPN